MPPPADTTPVLHNADCSAALQQERISADLIFCDPPFNQNHHYREHDDAMPAEQYWNWLTQILTYSYGCASEGASLYLMQREKNAEMSLKAVRESGWTFQNLIVWQKMAAAVPGAKRLGKHYQIIVSASKGAQPRVFNPLRADLPLEAHQSKSRENGALVTDVWSDIRELTSGYFAGQEPLRDSSGERAHLEQSPLALLVRIILLSSLPGDTVLDPFCGTGTTLVAASQLGRCSVGIESDPVNCQLIAERLADQRTEDSVAKLADYYRFTPNLNDIWGSYVIAEEYGLKAVQERLWDQN